MKRPHVSMIVAMLVALGAASSTSLVQAARAKQKPSAPRPSGSGQTATSGPSTATTITVKEFGAAGDGIADDTAAIQRALDAGAGKQVYVPPGVYKVRPLWLRTSTTLKLDSGARLLLAPWSNGNLLTVTASGASVVGNGTLDGNRAVQTQGAAISVGGAGGVSIRDVRVVNTAKCGIYAANAANLTISGVSVSGTGYGGIFAEATTGQLTNVVVENSRIDRSSEGSSIVEGGIVVHRTGGAATVSGVRISGNIVTMPRGPWGESVAIETFGGVQGAVVQGNTTNGGFIGISVADTTSASVTANAVSSASEYGIELAASRQTTVSGNTVDCIGYTPEGIVLDNTKPADNTISGNTVRGCVARGIALNEGSDRVSIVGNQISQRGGYAIEILTSAGVKVTNNVLDGGGSALKAVVGESSTDIAVSGNRVSRFTVKGVLLYRSDRASIVSNTISQSGGDAIHLMRTAGATLSGNSVDGAKTTPNALLIDTSSSVAVTKNAFSNFTQCGVLLYGASPTVLDLITITGNTFTSTQVPYRTQLSGGAKLGKVVFSGNATT